MRRQSDAAVEVGMTPGLEQAGRRRWPWLCRFRRVGARPVEVIGCPARVVGGIVAGLAGAFGRNPQCSGSIGTRRLAAVLHCLRGPVDGE